MNTTIQSLVQTAETLAAIQIQGVEDQTGFSNADKFVGAHLAHLVTADPENAELITALAALVSKYKRQSVGMVGSEMFANFKDLAQDTKITPEQREEARHTILSVPGVHPKYGPQVVFSWTGFNESYAYAVRQFGAKAEKDPTGVWKWGVPAISGAMAAHALIELGATIVGSFDVPEGSEAIEPEDFTNKIEATLNPLNPQELRLNWSFGRHRQWNEIVKRMPKYRFDWSVKAWFIPLADLAIAHDAFKRAGADVSDFEILAPQAPTLAQIQPDEPDYGSKIDWALHAKYGKIDSFFDYQKEGIAFLMRPLTEIREQIPNGYKLRGEILGDDMGLGKTAQMIISANYMMEPGERAVIVCPASVKNNWVKEIRKWLSPEEKVHIIDALPCPDCGHGGSKHASTACIETLGPDGRKITKWRTEIQIVDGLEKKIQVANDWHFCKCASAIDGGFDPTARWNIVNYDILQTHYGDFDRYGFAVLICDEAHYVKNRESSRSKWVVGGKTPMPKIPTDRDMTTVNGKAIIKGLVSMATRRVWMATGTPMTNRPRDLFNLLKGVGHPLGSNFLSFGRRYCDPQSNRFGTTYNGAANLLELREEILPIFIQRKKEDHLNLPPKLRTWLPVEVDLKAYWRVMGEYEARRKSGELSSIAHHLAALTEARVCAAIAKVEASIELIENAVESGQKVLVFSTNKTCVRRFMEHFGNAAVKIDGDDSRAQRTISEERFMTDDSVRIIVGNLMAMGVGLNLTAGSYVIVNDLDWVPANHKQAEDRCYRIGQTLMVNVIYVLAAGTFDEELAVIIEDKVTMVNDFEAQDPEEMFTDFIARIRTAPQNDAIRKVKHGGSLKKVA